MLIVRRGNYSIKLDSIFLIGDEGKKYATRITTLPSNFNPAVLSEDHVDAPSGELLNHQSSMFHLHTKNLGDLGAF